MPDTFAITVAFIAVSTLLAAFFRRRQQDKCVRDFDGADLLIGSLMS